jgi:ABC-type multidrug transport system fused ATPase/permease subunit
LTGISTLSIGDVNSLSQEYISPPGFTWADLYKDIPSDLLVTSDIFPPPPIQSWCWSIMNMFLFLTLAWYLDSILPDEYGVRQKPFFFIHKSYWGYDNSEQENQSRDLQTWQTMASAHYIQNSTPKPSKGSIFTRLFRRHNTFTSKTSSDITLSPASSLEQKPCADIEVSLLRDAAHDISTPAALRVVHLRKVFANFVAVNDSNFVMHQGELLAVLGANGSGKSTTCHILCGITPATAGDALVDDSLSLLGNVGGKNSVGWCPQHDILFDELTPIEHVFTFMRGLISDSIVCVD